MAEAVCLIGAEADETLMRQIVIAGASGLLGSHLLPLLERRANICAVPGDLAEGLDVAALPSSVEAVIYLAQSRRFRDFPEAAAEVARVNTLAAVDLAQYAAQAGATHFIYASTGGVYARAPDPLAETAPLSDLECTDFYASTKLAAERLLAPFSRLFSLVVLRPFFIYGRGQDRSMLIPRLIDAVKGGTPVRLAGPDGMRLNPIHAADAAAAVAAALELDGRHTINLAGPETLTLREIAEEIGSQLGKRPSFTTDPAAAPMDLIGDTALMARLLHAPRERLRDRLGELIG